jgi:hypothetical protein
MTLKTVQNCVQRLKAKLDIDYLDEIQINPHAALFMEAMWRKLLVLQGAIAHFRLILVGEGDHSVSSCTSGVIALIQKASGLGMRSPHWIGLREKYDRHH